MIDHHSILLMFSFLLLFMFLFYIYIFFIVLLERYFKTHCKALLDSDRKNARNIKYYYYYISE